MSEIGKYRKKPIVIEAMRWMGPPDVYIPRDSRGDLPVGPSVDDLQRWGARVEPTAHWGGACGDGARCRHDPEDTWSLLVYVEPEGSWVRCPLGFWIIKGIKGEFYPCDPEVFAQTYEPAG